MKLTPQDIVSFKFGTTLKGYDRDEVSDFLHRISEAYKDLCLQNRRLTEENQRLQGQIRRKEKDEEILRNTLVSAQKFSNDVRKNAGKEADLIVRDAEIKAEEIISESILKTKEAKEAIKNLQFKRRELENDIINMLNSLKDLIRSYRKEDDDLEKIKYME